MLVADVHSHAALCARSLCCPDSAAHARQVCKHPFSFTPVYAPDAPATLPLHELLLGLGRSVLRGCKSAVRVRPLVHERARPDPRNSAEA